MDFEMIKEKSSFNSPHKSPLPTMSRSPQRSFFMAQLILRILAIAFTVAALTIMVTSEQSVSVFGIVLQARYTYSSAFRFKVGADCVVCALSLLGLIIAYALSRPKSNPNNYFFLFLLDMVMMLLTISASAAATAIGFLGRYGLNQTGWMPICDRVDKFCDKVTLSILSSYLSLLCYLVLEIMDAYRLKSPPRE